MKPSRQEYLFYISLFRDFLSIKNYIEARKCAYQAIRNTDEKDELLEICTLCIESATEHRRLWFEAIYAYQKLTDIYGTNEFENIRATLLEGKKQIIDIASAVSFDLDI